MVLTVRECAYKYAHFFHNGWAKDNVGNLPKYDL